MARSDRWARRLRFLPPALLVAVALVQVALVVGADLAPWQGGGFGMFSSVDAGGRRHLHAFQVRPGLLREVPLPPDGELGFRVGAALALPTDANLRPLAVAVARVETRDDAPLQAVRIQVFRPRFEPGSLAPSSSLVREFVLALPAQ